MGGQQNVKDPICAVEYAECASWLPANNTQWLVRGNLLNFCAKDQ